MFILNIFIIQHLRSLILNDHDNIGEKGCKCYQRQRYEFFIERADGRYNFKVSSGMYVISVYKPIAVSVT